MGTLDQPGASPARALCPDLQRQCQNENRKTTRKLGVLLYFAILCTIGGWEVISPPLSMHPHQQTRELQYQAQPVDWSGAVSGEKKQKTFMKHGPYRDTGVGNNCVCGIYTPKVAALPSMAGHHSAMAVGFR